VECHKNRAKQTHIVPLTPWSAPQPLTFTLKVFVDHYRAYNNCENRAGAEDAVRD